MDNGSEPAGWATAIVRKYMCVSSSIESGFFANLLVIQICRPLRGLGQSFSPLIPGLAPRALCFRALRALFLVLLSQVSQLHDCAN
jgi:hypothetical protein